MTHDPQDLSAEDARIDELLQPRELGGDLFVAWTLDAIRQDTRRRRLRAFWTSTSVLAASVVLVFSLWPVKPGDNGLQMAGKTGPSTADAALYGEMLALEDLLLPADIFAQEENQQTLDFLIYLTQN
jgi:hypothetical protein